MERMMTKFDEYLHRLSDLGREYGIGLTGEIQSYELERDDTLFDYSADEDGKIVLGDQPPVKQRESEDA